MGNQLLSDCNNDDSSTQRVPNIDEASQRTPHNLHSAAHQQQKQKEPIEQFPFRQQNIDKVYQRLIKESKLSVNLERVNYSIENPEFLQYYGIEKLRQIQKFTLSSPNSSGIESQSTNKKNTSEKQLEENSQETKGSQQKCENIHSIKVFRLYLEDNFSRLPSLSQSIDSGSSSSRHLKDYKNIQDSSYLEPFPETQNSFANIYREDYIYVGQTVSSKEFIPNGSGQLYQNQKQKHNQGSSASLKSAKELFFVEAQFRKGEIQCTDCIIITSKGHYYRGGFCEGNLNGKGKLELSDGSIFDGQFVNGYLQGKGVKVYEDGGIYRGNFAAGRREGKGTMVWKSHIAGSTDRKSTEKSDKEIFFEGIFSKDAMNGLGYLRTPNYEYWGPFQNNMKEGKGTIIFKDGRKFQGWFQKDEIKGYGELKHPNGQIQKGVFPMSSN